jgi:hypothetical protein
MGVSRCSGSYCLCNELVQGRGSSPRHSGCQVLPVAAATGEAAAERPPAGRLLS